MILENMVFVDIEVASKEEAIAYMAKQARQEGLVLDESAFVQAVLEREAMFSTAVAPQLAIPHGKSESVLKAFVGFMRSKEDVLWSEDAPVKLLFMIGVPMSEASSLHLQYIAAISRKLIHQDFVDSLLSAKDKEGVMEVLSTIQVG